MFKGVRPKIYYATQVSIQPPTFVFFSNHPAELSAPYRRFLYNYLRQNLGFDEIPMKLVFRKRAGSNESKKKQDKDDNLEVNLSLGIDETKTVDPESLPEVHRSLVDYTLDEGDDEFDPDWDDTIYEV